jgi:hypothetical protein
MKIFGIEIGKKNYPIPSLETILRGTPIQEVLKFHQENKIHSEIRQISEYISQNKPKKALKMLNKEIKERTKRDFLYIHSYRSLPFIGLESWSNKSYWGGSYGHGYEEQFADLCIIAGRLASHIDHKNCDRFYEAAAKALKKSSSLIGAGVFYLGLREPFKDVLLEWNENITKREKMVSEGRRDFFLIQSYDRVHKGDFREGIKYCTKAIVVDPNSATAYNNRGVFKEQIKDYQGAIADYEKALEIDPDPDFGAGHNLSRLKRQLEEK